jgi:RNA polymerase sigma factor for flagellar operon FliA
MEQDARALLVANIGLIRQVVRTTARRHRLTESERQDFESWMWVRLVDHDFYVIRRFEGRSSFATYLRVVMQRGVLDFRAAKWGKWRPSAHARRLGPKAVALERLITRDGMPPEAAAACLNVSANELPVRPERRRHFNEPVELSANLAAPQGTSPEEGVLSNERRAAARAASRALARSLAGIPRSDRQLLWLRYGARLSVAQIAVRLGLEQRGLYRKFVLLHAAVRTRLEQSGITSAELAGVIGAPDATVQGAFSACGTADCESGREGAWPMAS